MSEQLYTAISKILEMPYYKNDHSGGGTAVHSHEDAVGMRISDAGFVRLEKHLFPKLTSGILKRYAEDGNPYPLDMALTEMKSGAFIVQPGGSQHFPDILVKDFDGRFILIECKSTSDSTYPVWNDNVPRKNAIYVYSSKKTNETTVFQGKDVISQLVYDLMSQHQAELREIDQKYKKMYQEADVFGRGWQKRVRPQNMQLGGRNITNWFDHHNRKQCEENVLRFSLNRTEDTVDSELN